MSDLEPIQRSRLGEIGQLLAEAREEKGLTLEEVSGKTLIRAGLLKAIEEGDARPLPEPVYIRGFIRRFGDLVGLNGMELCDSFPWQPSGSVPLSFVSAGNVVPADAAPQKPVTASAPETPEPPVEPMAVEAPAAPELDAAPPLEMAVTDASNINVALDSALAESDAGVAETSRDAEGPLAEIEIPEPVGADGDADLSMEGPQAVVAIQPEPGEEPSPIAESAVLDHEAAYESRAALFGDEIEAETEAVAAAGAAIAATGPAVMSQSFIDNVEPVTEGGDRSAAPAARGMGGATLPPPPAPVMYREPETSNLMPWLLAVVAGALGLGVAFLAFGGNRSDRPNVANDPAPVEQVETAGSGATATDAPGSEAATPDAAASTEPQAAVPADKVVLELEVKGSEAAWMDVSVDGELQIEGNQAPGFKQRWEGSQEIELATARPDMVWISVNGSQPQPFGKFEEAQPVKIGGFKPANAQ